MNEVTPFFKGGIAVKAAIPISCLLLMAALPSVLYYDFLQSENSSWWEPEFTLGSYRSFLASAIIWIMSAVFLAILLALRLRSTYSRSWSDLSVSSILLLTMFELAGAAMVLIVFAVSTTGDTWSDAGKATFCLFPTLTLVTGGVVFIEGDKFLGGMGRVVRSLSVVLAAISVPWAVFVALIGFLGFGGPS